MWYLSKLYSLLEETECYEERILLDRAGKRKLKLGGGGKVRCTWIKVEPIVGLPNLDKTQTKATGCTVKCEFQINNKYLVYICPTQYLGHTHTTMLFIAYLISKFNWCLEFFLAPLTALRELWAQTRRGCVTVSEGRSDPGWELEHSRCTPVARTPVWLGLRSKEEIVREGRGPADHVGPSWP